MADTIFNHDHAVDPSAKHDISSLQGKSVVITGAASGIGEACMRSFVAAGAFVTFGDLSSDRAQSLVSELGQDKVAFYQCDTRSWQDQANLFKAASDRCNGNIDIVFANAGISGIDPVFQDQADPVTGEPVEPDLSILLTNLGGIMYTTKLALHYFAHQAGGGERDRCLIMTSSLAGYLDLNGAVQYSASKFGVRGMMRSLRRKLPEHNARVNIIAPWFVRTGITSSSTFDRLKAANVNFADINDATAAVLHLASDPRLNGRALAIVPREIAPRGYFDLEKDDDQDDDVVFLLQQKATKVDIRAGTQGDYREPAE